MIGLDDKGQKPFDWRSVKLNPIPTIREITLKIRLAEAEHSYASSRHLTRDILQGKLLAALRKRMAPVKRKSRKLHTTHLLHTQEWKIIRERVFTRDGRVCKRCGTIERLQIDHILPKSLYPFLSFDMTNLQVLCQRCNFRKNREEDRVTKNAPTPRHMRVVL